MDGYRALLIGNSTFPADPHNLQELHGPVKDVAVLGSTLTDRDTGLFDPDHVRLLVERPAAKVLEEVEAFFSEARRDDQLLLYYSGHGLLDERNQLYLGAANTRVDRLRSTAVSAAEISEMLNSSAARTAVILLDCCHSGAFKGNIGPGTLAGSGRFVLTSCRSGELANDADRRNGTSLFTQHLVDGLMGGVPDLDADGRIDVDEVYRYVHERLMASNRQIPQRRFDGSVRTPALARRPLLGAGTSSPQPPLPSPDVGAASAAPTVRGEDPGGPAEVPPGRTVPPSGAQPAAGVPSTSPVPSATGAESGLVSRWLHGPRKLRLVLVAAVVVCLLVSVVLAAALWPEGGSEPPPPRPGPAGLNAPEGLFLEVGDPGVADDTLSIADSGNNRVVDVELASGSSSRSAGSQQSGDFIEGLPATETPIDRPVALAGSSFGGVILDKGGTRLLGLAQDGKLRSRRPEGPLSASITPIRAVAADPRTGSIYLTNDSRVVRLDATSNDLVGVAGTDEQGFAGDGGDAVAAQLRSPRGLVVDWTGENLYIADCENNRVRKVNLTSRKIVTVAGGGEGSYLEGGRATDVTLSCPSAMAIDYDDNLYVVDGQQFVRKLANEKITTVAGSAVDDRREFTDDGRPAIETTFTNLAGLAINPESGGIYLTEGNRVRYVDPTTGTVSTVA